MCGLLVFLSAVTQDVLLGDNGGESSPLNATRCADGWRRPDAAGRASAGPGRAASFIDHERLSGPWLPLWLQNLPQPGRCTCPSPWRPISATLSSAHPDSLPPKLRQRTLRQLCVTGGKYSSTHRTTWLCPHGASFPWTSGHWGPTSSHEPVLLNALPCFMPQHRFPR